jgi:hypothetical protein
VCLLCLAGSASAGVVPYGVQNDVPLNTILNDWGWTIVYQGDYGNSESLETMFGGATGEYVMLAGIQDGSSTVDVLAAAPTSEVFTYTALNATHAANGAEWYYNGSSMGFAGLGEAIQQNSADGYDVWTLGSPERDRLSWHTLGGSGSTPTAVDGGWRSGPTLYLNSGDTGWDRLVLTYTGDVVASVPAPGAILLGTLGAGLVGWMRRRRAL